MRFTILHVEDNPADVRLCKEAVRGDGAPPDLMVARDGDEALNLLSGNGASPAPTPDLILLDLNVPKRSGLEVLRTLRATPHVRSVPVVALTSSAHQRDIDAFYEAGGNAYLTKPLDLEKYMSTVASVLAFWREVARRPSKARLNVGQVSTGETDPDRSPGH